ncbi:unnamed protein product [Eruca vesicaria subsp. sativa]|uniref:Uncharacterized protein n=1 Tax=Eruca vesicaria subsp. sativa TaxID=29727 RepID=A0ABC8M8L5_ERUVS|nr:unnamed protein product [Eruca vesicaria subsp. sativa]
MTASKTTIFIVFILCLSGTLLVNVSGQRIGSSCSTSEDCELMCFGGLGGGRGECWLGECSCWERKTETKLAGCKTNRDCPPSLECPKIHHNVCVIGKCICLPA